MPNKNQNFSDFNENGNGVHAEANGYAKNKNFELSIDEANSDDNKEQEFSNNNNNNSNNPKNYDNVNMPVENGCCDEEEKLELVISKDSKYNDFGFSISDSVYGQGIYINKIRADNSNENLKPFCKVFKVF